MFVQHLSTSGQSLQQVRMYLGWRGPRFVTGGVITGLTAGPASCNVHNLQRIRSPWVTTAVTRCCQYFGEASGWGVTGVLLGIMQCPLYSDSATATGETRSQFGTSTTFTKVADAHQSHYCKSSCQAGYRCYGMSCRDMEDFSQASLMVPEPTQGW